MKLEDYIYIYFFVYACDERKKGRHRKRKKVLKDLIKDFFLLLLLSQSESIQKLTIQKNTKSQINKKQEKKCGSEVSFLFPSIHILFVAKSMTISAQICCFQFLLYTRKKEKYFKIKKIDYYLTQT